MFASPSCNSSGPLALAGTAGHNKKAAPASSMHQHLSPIPWTTLTKPAAHKVHDQLKSDSLTI
jgi:hypothetical protein